LRKHQDENIAVFPDARLVFMVPAYREMSNGNIPKQLLSLSLPDVPKDEVALVYVINNTLLQQFCAEHFYLFEANQFSDLLTQFRTFYASKKGNNTEDERQILFALSNMSNTGEQNIDPKLSHNFIKHARTYQENQASIEILRFLSKARDGLNPPEGLDPVEKKQLLQEYTIQLQEIWQASFAPAPLPRGLVAALARGVQVAVIDNSSQGKGFATRDIGQAKNEGLHLSFLQIAPNAGLVQPIDADTYPPPDLVSILLRLAAVPKVEAVFVPQYTNTNRLPEQFSGRPLEQRLKDIVGYYRRTLYTKMQYYSETTRKELGGSQIAISRTAYEKLEYPHGDNNTDFTYSHDLQLILKPSRIVRLTQARHMLNLMHRGREESIDGGSFANQRNYSNTFEEENEGITFRSTTAALEWMQENRILIAELKKLEPHYLDDYVQYLRDYREKVQSDRKIFLRRFSQLLPHLAEVIISGQPPEKAIKHLESTMPSGVLQSFVQDNHLLFTTLIEHFREQGMMDPDSIQAFLQQQLPEYFLPVPSQPVKVLEHERFAQKMAFAPGFSLRDFIYIPLAREAFFAQLKDEGKNNQLQLLTNKRP